MNTPASTISTNTSCVSKKNVSLTIEELKKYKGLEHLSDTEAEAVLHDLTQLAGILFKVYHETKK